MVLIFHRPLLFAVAHRVAVHFASKENLKAEFRLEGNPFGSLTIRNVHVFPIGPSARLAGESAELGRRPSSGVPASTPPS